MTRLRQGTVTNVLLSLKSWAGQADRPPAISWQQRMKTFTVWLRLPPQFELLRFCNKQTKYLNFLWYVCWYVINLNDGILLFLANVHILFGFEILKYLY